MVKYSQLCAKCVLSALQILSHLIFSINLTGLVMLSLYSTDEESDIKRHEFIQFPNDSKW